MLAQSEGLELFFPRRNPLTWIHPLHSVGVDVRVILPSSTQSVCLLNSTVAVKIVSSIAWIDDDCVGVHHSGAKQGNDDNRLPY